MKMFYFFSTALIVAATVYSTFAKADSLNPSKIIGENNLIVVNANASNVPAQWGPYLDAIGWTNYGCTVTHIGKNKVLTAGHCFEAKKELEKDKGCSFANITWGYRKGVSSSLKSKCQKIIAMQNNEEVDFALLQVDKAPQAFFEIDTFQNYPAYSELTVFSHPEGRTLEWSQTCLLEAERHPQISKEFFNHKCDTEPGSSGALILDVLSQKVMGIHKGGIPETNYATFLNKKTLADILNEVLAE